MGKPQGKGKKQPLAAGAAKAIKEGQVKKNKQEKFKQTPGGKVALINGKANGKQHKQPIQKSPQGQKKSPNPGQGKKNAKQQKKSPKVKVAKEDSEDEDINEGITLKEDVSMEGSLSDDSDSEAQPDIFGQSLADDSDDDDDDFEETDGDDDDKEEEEVVQKKGVNMFKGTKVVKNEIKEEVDDEEDDDEDEDEDEDEEEEDDDESSEEDSKDEPGLKALIGDSIVDDDSDEDFDGEKEDEDEDEEDEDMSDDEVADTPELNQSNTSSSKSEKELVPRLTDEEKAEQDKRTIFIGNVPMAVEEKTIKATFNKFGPIQSIRIRGIIPDSPKTPLKVAAITKKFNQKTTAKCAFVIYKAEESVDKSLTLNGTQLEGNYLRVDRVNSQRKVDPKKAVFVGNLPFDVEDNELWELFGKCGKFDWVRTVRDRQTGGCRGIGYINFENEDSVALAMNLSGEKLRKREIRVKHYAPPLETKSKTFQSRKRPQSGNVPNSAAKKTRTDTEVATKNSQNAERRKTFKRSQGQQKRGENGKSPSPGGFQGQKADHKKKGKKDGKFEKKKKFLAGKLTAKPKKPVQ